MLQYKVHRMNVCSYHKLVKVLAYYSIYTFSNKYFDHLIKLENLLICCLADNK